MRAYSFFLARACSRPAAAAAGRAASAGPARDAGAASPAPRRASPTSIRTTGTAPCPGTIRCTASTSPSTRATSTGRGCGSSGRLLRLHQGDRGRRPCRRALPRRTGPARTRAGLPRGAYHYYYFCRPAAEQAAWFINHVPRDPSALPPVLDLEWTHKSRTCPYRPDPATVRSEAGGFLQALQVHYRKRPVIYTTVDFYRDNELWRLDGYPFWLRSVAGHPSEVYPGQRWPFWQYTGTGVVDGIDGPTDLNVFSGSFSRCVEPGRRRLTGRPVNGWSRRSPVHAVHCVGMSYTSKKALANLCHPSGFCASMIVARQPLRLRDPLVLHRRLQHRAGLELADDAALDLLPGRLVRRVAVAALRLQRRPPREPARLVDQRSSRPLVQVEHHPVAGLDQRQRRRPRPPPARRSGSRASPEVPDCRPSPTQTRLGDPLSSAGSRARACSPPRPPPDSPSAPRRA